jgi:hypothetical protein
LFIRAKRNPWKETKSRKPFTRSYPATISWTSHNHNQISFNASVRILNPLCAK